MRNQWRWIGTVAVTLLLSACTRTIEETQAPQQPSAYNGPVTEIGGVEPQYEPYHVSSLQDYQRDGVSYRIVKDPQNFSQTGLAAWRNEDNSRRTTAIGEASDSYALSAAHPTLPIPSYVRVTNLANGRQLVVRVNDRGPYAPGRIIELSKTTADRLNLSNNTKVKVDFIQVSAEGLLSGPGSVGTRVAKQSYALPTRPDLDGSNSAEISAEPQISAPSPNTVSPIENTPLNNNSDVPAANHQPSGGFLGAPSALPAGVLESSEPVRSTHTVASTIPTNTHGNLMIQVGALSDVQRAQLWQQKLSQQFSIPGAVSTNGTVYRVQLGPFSDRQQALVLQQRLMDEAQQQSFITTAP